MACSCTPERRVERLSNLPCAFLLCKALGKRSLALYDAATIRTGDTPEQTRQRVDALAKCIPWKLLGQLFPEDPLALLTATCDTVSTAFVRLISEGDFDEHKTDRGFKERLLKLCSAFESIGRDCTRCCQPILFKDNGVPLEVSPLQPLSAEAIKRIQESLSAAKKKRRNDLLAAQYLPVQDPSTPSPVLKKLKTDREESKFCPPVNMGFAAAMLVSLGRQVIADLLATDKCGPREAKSRIIRSILLRDVQINLVFGKRPCELRGVERYANIYCVIGDECVPLRVLQLAGPDVVLKYLRAGFPVVWALLQGKSRKDCAPLRVFRTIAPDGLSLLEPAFGTLLHYQIWDKYARIAMNLPVGSVELENFYPQYEYPVDTRKLGDVGEGDDHSPNIQKWRDTWIYTNGDMSADPVCAQLYGMHRKKEERLHHTTYAYRYTSMGTLAMLKCNLKAVAHAMGHHDPDSQNGYAKNNLVACYRSEDGSLVGEMNPKLDAQQWYLHENDMPGIFESPLYSNHLCIATNVTVSYALLRATLGDPVVDAIIAAHKKFKQPGGVSAVPAYNGPCVQLRLDGLKNVSHLVSQPGTCTDSTPAETKKFITQNLAVLHGMQGISREALGEPTWDIRFSGQLLGAVLRPFKANEVHVLRLAHDVGWSVAKLGAVIAADENVKVLDHDVVHAVLQRKSKLLDQYAESAKEHMLHTLAAQAAAPAPKPAAAISRIVRI